jgi:protein-tyrosine phosphatase
MDIPLDIRQKAEDAWLRNWIAGPRRLRWTELPVQTGDSAPVSKQKNEAGADFELREAWKDSPAVLIFLRHFGCGCAWERAERLVAEFPKLIAAGAIIVAVGQGDPARCRQFREHAGMAARTSLSHPLHIAEVIPPHGSGRIGITFCPGKKQRQAMSGAWDRDLGIDLDAVKSWGAAMVITLIEAQELAELEVPTLGEEVLARGMAWLHLPIADVSILDRRFVQGWAQHGPRLLSALRDGARVLVHCKGGLGRAGTVAALMLVQSGMNPAHAIAAVRAARPGAIETRQQEDFIRSHESPKPM